MSIWESRGRLIQQRQAEIAINLIRIVILLVLSVALGLRAEGLGPSAGGLGWFPLLLLAGGWLYALIVYFALNRGLFPGYLPWLTTVVDLLMIGAGLGMELTLTSRSFTAIVIGLNWGYAVFFLLILFSALRERPVITLVTAGGAVALSVTLTGVSFQREPFDGFWAEQVFRVLLLVVAGLFSSFHARTVRSAVALAAQNDRLRRETDSRLKGLAQHFPGVLFQAEVVDGQIQMRYVSEGSRDLLGLEGPSLVENPSLFFDRCVPSMSQQLVARSSDVTNDFRSEEWEFSYQTPDLVERWLLMRVTGHESSPGVQVLNGLMTDITEARQVAQALREANEAKTDFLATMSHELRTPLNAILGNADHLSHLATQEDDRRAVRDLQASGETLLGLIEDILVFSRLEAGRLAAEIRPFAWRSQFETLLATFRPVAQAKGLSLTADFPTGGPPILFSDSLRLRQILSNLLSNAIKFTPAGVVALRVRIEGTEQARLLVEVQDTGIGVPEDQQNRIFDKFTQGEHGKSRSYGGLGLGLSIARSLAGLLGGSLTLDSQPGAGSTFRLVVPVRAETDVQSSPMGTEQFGTSAPCRTLLVEDNLTNQDVAQRMLRKLGCEVDVAPGGREALTLAATTFYEVIFMDWQMPVMDGREATARIRALPGGQDLVIIALSGHALPGDRELLLASGFDDYLSKPVRMEDFRAMLAKWVSHRPDRG